MPLLTLKAVADELGYKSVQSVYNLAEKGELTITHLPNAGGSKRAKGPPRVDSKFVEALKTRISEAGTQQQERPADKAGGSARSSSAAATATKAKRPRRKPLGAIIHFE